MEITERDGIYGKTLEHIISEFLGVINLPIKIQISTNQNYGFFPNYNLESFLFLHDEFTLPQRRNIL